MLPKQIVFVLTMFNTFGVCNSGNSKLSKYQIHIYFVHFFVATFLIWYLCRLTDIYYSKILLLDALSEILQYLTALSTYCLIICDSIAFRREHHEFWTLVQQIDRSYNSQIDITFRSFTVKFRAYLLKTIIISAYRLCIPYVDLRIDSAYIYLFIMCEVRMFYYIFCLEILYFQLKAIDKELRTIIDEFHANENTLPEFPCERFKWVRGYFHCVYRMMYLLNKIVGWSHVSAISYCFFFLLTEIHWYYIHYNILSDLYKICKHYFMGTKCLVIGINKVVHFHDFQSLPLQSYTGLSSYFIYST